MSVLLSLGACAKAVEHPSARSDIRPRPTPESIISGCTGGEQNEVHLESATDRDAPVLVLDENHLHGEQPARPTIAIWSDGRVVFSHVRSTDGDRREWERLQGAISPTRLEELVRSVTREIVSVPRHTNANALYFVDGGQLTTITVHDGSRWLVASVYDAYERDFLASLDGTAEKEAKKAAGETVELDGLQLPAYQPPKPPLPFARAYKSLLDAKPSDGDAFVPYDFDLVFMLPDAAYDRRHPAEMPWPADLPAPPSVQEIESRDPKHESVFILDAMFRDSGLLLRSASRSRAAYPYVMLDGQRYVVRVDEYYRGERDIAALNRCSIHLAGKD